ncbi:MAG: UvrD-helicase domain-containing protein [Bdellovibrionales bacterium]|nr:UvrD-helicase domain-containing protein [Bdellovibrionales bacterium]
MINHLVDENVRQKATSSFEKNFTVEASAGTGKTTLLAKRFVNLVRLHGVHPSAIVAITFTEKAAFELNERIESIFKQKYPDDPLLIDLRSSTISTIHAFCTKLLKEYCIEACLDPEFSVIDPMMIHGFLKSTFYKWLSGVKDDQLSLIKKLMDGGISLTGVYKLGLDLYHHRDLSMKQDYDNDDCVDSTHELKTMASVIVPLWKHAQDSCLDRSDEGFKLIEKLYSMTKDCDDLDPNETESTLLRLSIKSKGSQKNWSSKQDLQQQKKELGLLATRLDIIQTALRKKIFCEVLEIMKGFVNQVELKKNEQSLLDFDDLLIKVRDLLKDQSGVKEQIQRRFSHILVDEVQDTDPLQAEILWRISSDQAHADWRETQLTPGKLFVVGDPKQSIYRFRKANLEMYTHMNNLIEKHGEKLVIQQNFRSSRPITDSVNQIFRKLFIEQYSDISALDDHQFLDSQSPIHFLIPSVKNLQTGADDLRKVEAAMIAGHIRNMLLEKRTLVFDPVERKLRNVTVADIAVLFPTTTGIEHYEEALRDHGLPFSIEGGGSFFERHEIHGVIETMKASLYPQDSVCVVAALKSVIFGCSDDQLLKLFQVSQTFDYRKIDTDKLDRHVQAAVGILKKLNCIGNDRPSIIVSRLIEWCFVLPAAMLRYNGEQACGNLHKLELMIKHLEIQNIQTLNEFLQWVNIAKQESNEPEAIVHDRTGERVHLLTIHRSKGLEFPIVILANMNSRINLKERIIVDSLRENVEVGLGSKDKRFATGSFEKQLDLEREAHLEEQKRMFYVALTRARDQIIMTKPNSKESLEGYNRWILDIYDNQDIVRSESEIDNKTMTRTIRMTKNIDDHLDQKINSLFSEYQSMEHGDSAILRGFRSDTKLNDSLGSKIGTLFHRVIEQLDYSKKNHRPLLKKICLEMGLGFLEKRVETLFENFYQMNLYDRLLGAQRIYREVPFVCENTNGEPFEGAMDCVFEDLIGWHIVDFKTDQSEDDSNRNYKNQMDQYAQAFKTSLKETPHSLILAYVATGTEKSWITN